MKSRRQGAILDIVDREPLKSQEQLRRRLAREGFEATQATLSRDIKELGLVKRAGDGAYQRLGVTTANPEIMMSALAHAAAEFVRRVDRVQQMLVIRTGAGPSQRRKSAPALKVRSKPLIYSMLTPPSNEQIWQTKLVCLSLPSTLLRASRQRTPLNKCLCIK